MIGIVKYEVVMKEGNTLFVYFNPKKDDSIEDIPRLNSKLIFGSYSSLAQLFVNRGKN